MPGIAASEPVEIQVMTKLVTQGR